MEGRSIKRKHVSWKAPQEVVDILDYMAYNKSGVSNTVTRADVLLEVVTKSSDFKNAKKEKEAEQLVQTA
jgi:hypothetical protein